VYRPCSRRLDSNSTYPTTNHLIRPGPLSHYPITLLLSVPHTSHAPHTTDTGPVVHKGLLHNPVISCLTFPLANKYPYCKADVDCSPVLDRLAHIASRLCSSVRVNQYRPERLTSSRMSMETVMPDRLRQGREPLPNLRGEDETEISYLTNLIECKSVTFHPTPPIIKVLKTLR
jgi:hypothetical protein